MLSLIDVIGEIESGNNWHAMRFEPQVFLRSEAHVKALIKARAKNRCSGDTARMIIATSWGRFQIMGFNLYAPKTEGGYDLAFDIGSFLLKEEVQLSAFEAFVRIRKIEYSVDELCERSKREQFARIYNGSLDYAKKIAEILTREGLKVGA